jgi:hypothetical protein
LQQTLNEWQCLRIVDQRRQHWPPSEMLFEETSYGATIPVDPARFLPKAVQQKRTENALRAELAMAGLSELQAERFSWRDAVPLTLGASGRPLALPLSKAVRAELTDALLARLRTVTGASDVDAVLDRPVLERIGH